MKGKDMKFDKADFFPNTKDKNQYHRFLALNECIYKAYIKNLMCYTGTRVGMSVEIRRYFGLVVLNGAVNRVRTIQLETLFQNNFF